jgi:MFS family permease
MVALDALVVSTALSTIRLDLGASIEQLEWTVNGYSLSFAVLLMTGAALGDRFGRRRIFVAGLGLFVAASALCALAPDMGVLIGARAIQGCGAALIMPLAVTQLSVAVPPEQRARALGIFIGVTALAVLAGPVVGGAIAQGLAWQVFTSFGDFGSAETFSAGFAPAMGVSAGLATIGALAAVRLPRLHKAAVTPAELRA